MPSYRYHHIGIPTTDPQPGEEYNHTGKHFAAGYATSPYGVEWLRFDARCELWGSNTLVRSRLARPAERRGARCACLGLRTRGQGGDRKSHGSRHRQR